MNFSNLSPIQIKLIKITLIVFLTIVTASYLKGLIRKKISNQYQNKIVLEQISDILYYGIIAFGLVLVLIEFGVQKSTILTLLVSVGITLGLSFQNILLKVFSGIYIIMMKLYDIGDSINVNSTTGQVVAFNLFNTTVRDQTKNIDIIIPNDIISDTELINYTRQSTSN